MNFRLLLMKFARAYNPTGFGQQIFATEMMMIGLPAS